MRRRVSTAAVLVGLLAACGDSPPNLAGETKTEGNEGGPCFPNGTCMPGLTCLSDLCVNAGPIDSGTSAEVDAGTPGASGCEVGYHDGGNGTCVSDGTCSPGYHDGGDGACMTGGTCTVGFHNDGLGTCVMSGCAAGFHYNSEKAACSGVAVSLSVGDAHACAVLANGGVKCWGDNYRGQLGDSTRNNDRPTPIVVSGLSTGVRDISAGGEHTCALMVTGGVKCWGNNQYGQVGDGTWGTDRLTPIDVTGLSGKVVAISAGANYTCAVMETGRVKCWGNSAFGELGDGTTTARLDPVDVVGLAGVRAIAAGGNHTCAVTNTGAAKCWGSNFLGTLGDGTFTDPQVSPVDIIGLSSGVKSISAQLGANTCALMEAGGVKCWGVNTFSEVGDGTSLQRRTPVDVSGLASGVVALGNTCAVMSSGSVKCWGHIYKDQIGGITLIVEPTPVDLNNLASGAIDIAGTGASGCALMENGSIKCWGYNSDGQVGDGTTTTRPSAVEVVGF